MFNRITDILAERRARRNKEEHERQESARLEEQARQQRDLEWAAQVALMQNSSECFESSSVFCDKLEIEGASVQLKSSGDPWTGQRLTEVKVTSPNRRFTLFRVYSYKAVLNRQDLRVNKLTS